jgi:galactitol-specific phosphotransferase system IIB component
MDEMKYEKIAEVERPQADVIESYLEAEGIDVEIIEESVWRTSYSTTFHTVQIFVPKKKVKQALELLKSFNLGMNEEEE